MRNGRVGFLDWDESRVDHADLDLAEIPGGPLQGHRADIASNAIDAWEAACGWTSEPDYARVASADVVDGDSHHVILRGLI
jgi:hypothetical protein